MRFVAVILAIGCALAPIPTGASTERTNPFARPVLDTVVRNGGSVGQQQGLELRGVIVDGAASIANINGNVLAIGETFDGHTLQEVSETTVLLLKDNRRLELSIEVDRQ